MIPTLAADKTNRAIGTISAALAEADEHRRRAGVIEANYYKELARASVAVCSDPAAAFVPGSDGGKAASSMLAAAGGIPRPGRTGALYAGYCAALLPLPALGIIFGAEPPPELSTVAYVTGSSADASFRTFKEIFSRYRIELRPHHADQIAAACDCVLDGDADLAIVPVWNDRMGRLRTFYRMIEDYDLSVISVTEAAAEGVRTRFAMCGGGLYPLEGAPETMEFSVRCRAEHIPALTEAITVHGHTVSEITSYPSQKGTAQTAFHFVINAGGDLRPTLLYLGLFHPDRTVLGIYGSCGGD